MYEEAIYQLHMHAKAIGILLNGYLPISLLPPSKLQEFLCEAKNTIQITNPDYDIVIKRLHLYYDMTLVTFRTDENRNLIIQPPVFVQSHILQLPILYQLETVVTSSHCRCKINGQIPTLTCR